VLVEAGDDADEEEGEVGTGERWGVKEAESQVRSMARSVSDMVPRRDRTTSRRVWSVRIQNRGREDAE
jgi:hypothetical protein